MNPAPSPDPIQPSHVPAAPPPPPLPALPRHRAHAHELAASAALEGVLAAQALLSPTAAAAARQVIARIVAVATWAGPHTPVDWGRLLGDADGGSQAGLYPLQVGDIHPRDVAAALTHGGTRVWVSMARRAEYFMAQLMHQLATRAETSPVFAARLAAEAGLNPMLLAERLTMVRAHYANDPDSFFRPTPEQACADIHSMRGYAPPPAAGHGWLWTDAPALNDISLAERNYLLRGGADMLAAGVALQTRVDATGQRHYRVPEARGTQLYRPHRAHRWHRQARAAGMHTAVSISGTTFRLMWMSRLLDSTPAQAEGWRLALLGHMVPAHHSYHEVMSAAAEHGMAYTPTLAGMVLFYRSLVTAAQPASVASAEPVRSAELVDIPRPGADPGSLDLLDLPDDLIDRIVAEVGARDLPHLLLAHRALTASAQRLPSLPAGRQLALRALLMRRQRADVMALFDARWATQMLSGTPVLSLSHRQLTDADVASIAQAMPRLLRLDLTANPITVLPARLWQHTELQGLSLAHTQVTQLPDFLNTSAGMDLRQLRLSAPLSQSLSWRQHLPLGLQHLNLSESLLTGLPDSVRRLQRLETLVLDDNLLTLLPRWLGELPALSSLQASGNQLTAVELATSPGSAPALQTLVLSQNYLLSQWPLTPGAAPQLRRIDIHLTAIAVPPVSQRPAGLTVMADAAAGLAPEPE